MGVVTVATCGVAWPSAAIVRHAAPPISSPDASTAITVRATRLLIV
jgi:hypothetical protein